MERYLPSSIEDALAQGLTRNPDYQQAQHALDAAQENVEAASAELLPYANLSVDAGRGKDRSASLREAIDESASISVQLTVPLYQKGQRSSQTRAARDQLQQARSERDRVKRQISESVVSAWASVTTADARILSLETQVETARVALEGVRREQDAGQRSILDILDAEQEVLNSSINLVTAHRDRSVAQFNLAVAIGMLQVREFDLGVPIYDDVEHYNEIRNQWWGTVTEVHLNE
jgi:outer membrane protein